MNVIIGIGEYLVGALIGVMTLAVVLLVGGLFAAKDIGRYMKIRNM